ncbi:MAG TPA: hypothetical protein VFQ53_30405 [Kofleriaceae bacterium]|nr:hypothetical protein [Kofleriaceae bacterium]
MTRLLVAIFVLASATAAAAPKRARAHGGFVDDMDCSACHTADGWKLAATASASGFDHDRTGFPLRGAHVQTTCSGCHTGMAKPASNCEGCHRDPHQGRVTGACAECHATTAWSDTKTLEQHRRTRMPLTGRHATLDCSDCHVQQGARALQAVPTDCYACHRRDYHDRNIHPIHDGSDGNPAFPRECGLCHRTASWSPAFANPMAIPGAGVARSALASGQHDAWFVLSTGSHRLADCTSCHVDARRMRAVRCDGCHLDSVLRGQHRRPVARTASTCLACHPRGGRR